MKKLFKRYKRQIFALLACFALIIPSFVVLCSADDTPPTFPPDNVDGSMIVNYSVNDIYLSDGGSSTLNQITYNYQVIPPNLFEDYSSYEPVLPTGNIYYHHVDGLFSTVLSNGAYSSKYTIESVNRTLTIHDIPLTYDNYLAFGLYYFVHSSLINPTLTLNIRYHLNDTPSTFSRTFYYQFPTSTPETLSFDTHTFYNILEVDNSLSIFIDTIEFNVACDYSSQHGQYLEYSFEVAYSEDSILNSDGLTSDDTETPDNDSSLPSYFFRDYVSWLAVAIGGFFSFELFPNFYLGGIFVIIIAFSLVMWWLKMFGGG